MPTNRNKKREGELISIDKVREIGLDGLGPSLYPKRVSNEFRNFGKRAEWLVVHDGLTLEEVHNHPDIEVALQTLNEWSAKYRWQDKRKKYLKRGDTITGLVYELLYSNLLDAKESQMKGGKMTAIEISNLEKLVKMFKQTGIPFPQQVGTVMKVYLRFVERKTAKGSQEQTRYMDFIKDFVSDVESGFIQPED